MAYGIACILDEADLHLGHILHGCLKTGGCFSESEAWPSTSDISTAT